MQLHNVTAQPLLQGMTPGSMGGPETEGLDFLALILGLQANPLNEMQGTEASAVTDALTGVGKNGESSEDALAGLFQKKTPNSWDPLSPNLVAGTMSQNLATPLKLESKLNVTGHEGIAQRVQDSFMLGGVDRGEKVGWTQDANRESDTSGTFDLSGINGLDLNSQTPESIKTDLAIQKYQSLGKQVGEEQVGAIQQPARPMDAVTQSTRVAGTSKMESGALPGTRSESLSASSAGKRRTGDQGSLGLDLLTASSQRPVVSHTADQASVSRTADSAQSSIPQLMDKVQTLAYHGGGKMTVALNPPNLGEVHVNVTARGNKIEIEMTSDNDAAKFVIERSLNDLVSSMEAQDLVVSKMEVSVGHDSSTFEQGTNFAFLNQGFSQDSQQRFSNQTGSQPFRSEISSERDGRIATATSAASAPVSSLGSGRVDIRI